MKCKESWDFIGNEAVEILNTPVSSFDDRDMPCYMQCQCTSIKYNSSKIRMQPCMVCLRMQEVGRYLIIAIKFLEILSKNIERILQVINFVFLVLFLFHSNRVLIGLYIRFCLPTSSAQCFNYIQILFHLHHCR